MHNMLGTLNQIYCAVIHKFSLRGKVQSIVACLFDEYATHLYSTI